MARINNNNKQQQQQQQQQQHSALESKALATTTHTTTISTTKMGATTNVSTKQWSRVTLARGAKIMHRKNDHVRDRRWVHSVCSIQLKSPCFLLLLITATTAAAAVHATHEQQQQQQQHIMPTTTGSVEPATSHITPTTSRGNTKYSQPLPATLSSDNNDDSFRPIIPKDISPEYISRNVFTETGQYRVFQPVESDLRVAAIIEHKGRDNTMLTYNKTTKHTTAVTMNTTMPTAAAATTTTATTDKTKVNTPTLATRKAKPTLPLTSNETTKGQTPQTVAGVSSPLEARQAYGKPVRKDEQRWPTKTPTAPFSNVVNTEMKGLQELLVEYVDNFFNKGQYEPLPELVYELQKNHSTAPALGDTFVGNQKRRPVRQVTAAAAAAAKGGNGNIRVNIPRALETGRLFFFSGLKKILWPIFMGLQILKSLLFAMFLPTLIGSFGKLLGKGIISGSAPLFIRPAEAPQDLDFRDNTFNFDDDNKFSMTDDGKDDGYAYNQAEASQMQNQYAYNPAIINQQALSRYGNEQNKMQDSYLSALQSIGSASFKNSNSISGGSSGGGLGAPLRTKPAPPANTNTFQTFQKVPASSLLLTNYDPFYSPLLSRLDSVFAQLKLNSDSEACREKLICLMYANPAKYAPYSNLVSAQLSRELNELRKPTSDNPDILRFFKYMRAAKDGQDGVDCEKSFDRCKEFKDFENPAMVSTYHDINKLVQARKLA